MRTLAYTAGSPFARAVRIVLDELDLEYEKREETGTPSAEERAAATPTLQVPAFRDGDFTLWESGLIVEYLLSTYRHRPATDPPLAKHAFRPEAEWQDKLVFSTIQTFGNAATTISQLKWAGVGIAGNAHLTRSAEKLAHILRWLEERLSEAGLGFIPDCTSMQDIFLAAHIRFVAARPIGIDLDIKRYRHIFRLLEALDRRPSFNANPIWWWEPGVVGYLQDGTPLYEKGRQDG